MSQESFKKWDGLLVKFYLTQEPIYLQFQTTKDILLEFK